MMSNTPSRESANALPYKADISCRKAWEILSENPAAQLVDVRTKQEWAAVGIPTLNDLNKQTIFIEWMTLPGGSTNGSFGSDLQKKVPQKDTPLLFLCKAGGRSMQAAVAMTAAGYENCYNVAGGFEGSGSSELATGWKTAQLPWENK